MIVKGMSARFNLGQFVQAENLAVNLAGLRGLAKDELDFNNIHTLFDVAGARGHVSSQGALVLNEPTFQSFMMAFRSLEMIPQESKQDEYVLSQAYDYYLCQRAGMFPSLHYGISGTVDYALVRLALMARCTNGDQFAQLKDAFDALPGDAVETLVIELNKSGLCGKGILLYYAPAVLVNARAAYPNPKEGLKVGMDYLAQLFKKAREQIPFE